MLSEDWEKLQGYSSEELVQAAEGVYESRESDFHEMTTVFEELGIVDERKTQVSRLCKVYLD